MDVVATKLIVTLLFALIRLFFGTLPIKIKTWLNKENDVKKIKLKENVIKCVIIVIQSFGGGVLFATCFLHMMPEVNHLVVEVKKYDVLQRDYPYAQLVISLGFFTIYFAEELCQWLIVRAPKKTGIKKESCGTNEGEQRTDRGSSATANGFAFEVRTIDALTNSYTNLETEKKYFLDDTTVEVVVDTIDQGIQTESNDVDSESVKNMEADLDVPTDINAEIEDFIEDDSKTQQQILRCFFVIIALSLHAIFEGLAIGLQQSIKNIWFLFIAVSIHSATVLYAIGNEAVVTGSAVRTIIIHMCMLSTTTSFGVLLGLVITLSANMDTSVKSFAIVLLEGLSTGTILYITFFETLKREKELKKWRLTRAIFIASGFTLMAALQGFGLGE